MRTNFFFLVLVEKNKLVIIFQRDELSSKLFLFFIKSVVLVKMINKIEEKKIREKKIFAAFLVAQRTRGQNK